MHNDYYQIFGMVGGAIEVLVHPARLIQTKWLECLSDEDLEVHRIPRLGIRYVGVYAHNGAVACQRDILPYGEGRTAKQFRTIIEEMIKK